MALILDLSRSRAAQGPERSGPLAYLRSGPRRFVPSIKGISHNPEEATNPADLAFGAEVLLQVVEDCLAVPLGEAP